ncbi:MAG TPA: PAS domain-containing protein [Anaerolineaceae bacterium]|nr:PAS domain-containing protein [Anaerolineaceae bacterium]
MEQTLKDKWTILLIDDDEDDYILTRSMLRAGQAHPMELEWAATFKSGLEKLQSTVYHAVLVDYDLGPNTGIQLIQQTADAGYPAPLILYSGRSSAEVDVEAMQAGATLYLPKSDANPLLLERSIRYAIERKQTEQALQERDRKLSVALDAAQLGTWQFDIASDRMTMDERAQKMYRAEQPVDLHERIAQSRLPPEDIPAMRDALARATDPAGDGRYQAEYRVIQPDGSMRWLNAWGMVEFEGEGTKRCAVRLTGASRDITVEKQAKLDLEETNTALQEREGAIQEIAGRLKEVLENALDFAYRRNLQTDQYDYLSPVVERVLGFSVDEMNDTPIGGILERIHPDDLPAVEAGIEASAQQGTGKLQYRFLCKDGRYRWLADHVTVTKDAHGNPLYRTGTVRDVTEQIQAQEALKLSEERFELASRAVPGILYDISIDRGEVYQSDGLEKIVGYHPGEEPGGSKYWWPRNIHPEDYARIASIFQASVEGFSDSYTYEYRIRHKDGHWVYIHDQGFILRDKNGQALRLVGTCTDISGQVQTKRDLRGKNGSAAEAVDHPIRIGHG